MNFQRARLSAWPAASSNSAWASSVVASLLLSSWVQATQMRVEGAPAVRLPAPLQPSVTTPEMVAHKGHPDSMERLEDIAPHEQPVESAGCCGLGGQRSIQTWYDEF